jgi:twitching motility protein PilT
MVYPHPMELIDICRIAVERGASDIHLKAGQSPMLRISGALETVDKAKAISAERLTKMAWNIMSTMQRDRFTEQPDLDLSWQAGDVGRFRVNVFRQNKAVGMVLRVIPDQVPTIEELGLPEVIQHLAALPRGLIIVTGTTGSGKSTTLAAMVEEVNRNFPHHIMTIEDPIEFSFADRKALINQREVGVDTASFTSGLKAALRQDPDVILLGELRDIESVRIALDAAETGHLVLTTLHTLDAVETISRLISFFEPHHHQQIRVQLASVLRAVLSQRLVPTVDGGRAAAVEIMRNTGTISECIVDPNRLKDIPEHIARGAEVVGSQTFDQAVYALLQNKRINREQALRNVNNPDELELKLQGIGHGFV